ncbi:MAG: hypothetical protein J7J09_05715 [Kosmotoga sp.]|uniref:hypothetical protein n=1 Tax=Kosmotoga sp. TaxID=1955248 RepID=UPI0025BAE346|nr:hypothetical protein [Kosmotoga sp.]MCD6160101.1 hypothetical protein [Kosmotoga sp.]
MIFFFSIFVWIMLSPSMKLENFIFAVISASVSWVVGKKVIPKGNAAGAVKVILTNIPIAVIQAFKMLFTVQLFSTSEITSPENRIEEFGKIVSITLTPKELVVLKEESKLIIHEVKKE